MQIDAKIQLLAHIPTPGISSFSLGPLTIHIYALCVLLGAVVALLGAYWRAKRIKLASVLMPAESNILDAFFVILPAGIFGARCYYVLTVPSLFVHDPLSILRIWEGGLGIIGGVCAGFFAAWLFFRKRNITMRWFAWCVAPMLPLAQCIGRLGNWFNAELYGTPTTLPWGLDISRGAYTATTFYHPTFAYEMILDLTICLVLLLIFRLPTEPSEISFNFLPFAFYLIFYSFGRFFIELLRTDYSDYLFGIRVNIFAIILFFLLGIALIAVDVRARNQKRRL
jgi:prolipoprotein diacylglyceryl transferase